MNEEGAYVDVADDEQDDDDEWTDEDAVQLEGEEEDADDEEEDEDEDEDEGNLQLQAANADAQPDVADFDGPIVLERRLVRADMDQPLAADAQFQDELDAEANIEDDMDGALEGALRRPIANNGTNLCVSYWSSRSNGRCPAERKFCRRQHVLAGILSKLILDCLGYFNDRYPRRNHRPGYFASFHYRQIYRAAFREYSMQ